MEAATPRGATPLFDAIERVVVGAEQSRPKQAVIVIMTDGEENASRTVTRDAARRHLDRCRERGWQVVFLGVEFDSTVQAPSLGASADQTLMMPCGRYSVSMDILAQTTTAYASDGAALAFTLGPIDIQDSFWG